MSTASESLSGARASVPIWIAVVPFAAVFGGLAVQAGWTPTQALLASATIYAGASQYVALDLWGQGVPAWTIVLTVFAVNFRHVLYSAALGRRMRGWPWWQRAASFAVMVDPAFAAGEARARSHGLTAAYMVGYGGALWLVWMVANAVGVFFGRLIENPADYGLDFILPIYFLGLVVAMRGTSRFFGIVAVSAAVAIGTQLLVGAPWPVLAGGLAGMAYAAARA